MAAKWQRWMPVEIDQLWGSASIQQMTNDSFKGYFALLTAQWQSEDGCIPNDAKWLWKTSRLTKEQWDGCSETILDNFLSIEGDQLRNSVNYAKWLEAKRIHEARCTPKPKSRPSDHEESSISDPRIPHTITILNSNNPKQKKKPSGKPETDHRHPVFHEHVNRYWKHKTGEEKAPWDGSEGKALSALLAAKPDLTLEQFRLALKHRGDSPDEVQTERPRQWLPNILRFAGGPLDRYGKPLQVKVTLPNSGLKFVNVQQEASR